MSKKDANTRIEGNRASDFVDIPCLDTLFGYAPLLKTQDVQAYADFQQEVVRCIKPRDVIEGLWLRHVVDLSWEIQRFRN